MKNFLTAMILCFALLLTVQCKKQGSSESKAENEDAILDADISWSNQATGLETMVKFFLDDAIVLPPNEPAVTGMDAIKDLFKSYYDMPGFKVEWQPTKVEAAQSGDIGYSVGTYELSMKDSLGGIMKDNGKYLTVWKKQPDGTWKVSADMFSSSVPMH